MGWLGGARRARDAIAGAAAAAVPAVLLRGFTVDDALIPARYAANLARGAGYRFNPGGPITDGVTALGWAHVLAPFAEGGPLGALAAAKWIGFVAWVLSAAVLGVAIGAVSDRRARLSALAIVATSAPLAAWSNAGLETGVVAALASCAVALRELSIDRAGVACAAMAAAWRPELLPWALVVSMAPRAFGERGARGAPHGRGAEGAAASRDGPVDAPDDGGAGAARGAVLRGLAALAPFAAVAAVRWAVFGRPTPLAAFAKPADAVLGAKYALACFLLTGPVSLVAPLSWRRLAAWPRFLVASVAAHFGAIALAGGDWMPLLRLVVPVLPCVALAAAHVASVSRVPATALRLALAAGAELWVLARIGPVAARVGEDRAALVRELRGVLAGARVVASLDVGWVCAATDANVVDLAGVTDPAIAALPGGHTTKAIPRGLLAARQVDSVVLLLAPGEPLRDPWTASTFARGVEQRIARLEGIEQDLAPVATATVPALPYVVLGRRAPAEAR